jgi:hypothetical protein
MAALGKQPEAQRRTRAAVGQTADGRAVAARVEDGRAKGARAANKTRAVVRVQRQEVALQPRTAARVNA